MSWPSLREVARDTSFPAISSGFVATLAGFTTTIALIFHTAHSLGANADQVTSWIWACGLGMGLCTIGLSLWTRMPVLVTWSTPGAAVIASAAVGGINLAEATGAFLLCGFLMWLSGASGLFERLMDRIPNSLASALLAGILAKIAMLAFTAAGPQPALIVSMVLMYLVAQRLCPSYAIPMVLAGGIAIAAIQGQLQFSAVAWQWGGPEWVTPSWSWQAMLGMGLPLFVVTMASQAVPGVAALRTFGYPAPTSSMMSWVGIATMALAPFGGYTFNLASITAAIVLQPHAHPNPRSRYTAAVMAGVFYLLMGLMCGAVASILTAFPSALIMAVSGLALLGAIATGLTGAMEQPSHREAAAITFLVTLSGVTLLDIGSAFWGLVAGVVTLLIGHVHLKHQRASHREPHR